jgi:hypothetical protein
MSKCTIYLPEYEFYISDVLDHVNNILTSKLFYSIPELESKLRLQVSTSEKIRYLENSLLNIKDEKVIDFFSDPFHQLTYKVDYNKRIVLITQSSLVNISETNTFDFSETEHVSLLGKELYEQGRIFEKYDIVEFDDFEKYMEKYMQLNSTLIEKLCEFIKFEYFVDYLDRLKSNQEVNHNIFTHKKTNLPYQIALLNELGFFEMEKIKNLPQDKTYQVLAKLLNVDKRGVSGNHRVLNPHSDEDRKRYTSYNYMDEVKKYLDNL